jgi:hypothetical protein
MFKDMVYYLILFVLIITMNLTHAYFTQYITRIFEDHIQKAFATTTSAAPTVAANKNNLLTYENSVLGISIQYPPDWLKREAKNGVIFQSPQENMPDIFKEQVGVSVSSSSLDNATTKSSLSPSAQSRQGLSSQVLNQEINQLKSSFPGFQLIQSLPTTLANGTSQAQMIVYSYKDNTVGMLKAMKIIAAQGTNLYKISYFAQPDKYDIYLPTIQTMTNSLKILNLSTTENIPSTTVKTLSASPVPPASPTVSPPSASPSPPFTTTRLNQTVLPPQQQVVPPPLPQQPPPLTSQTTAGQQEGQTPPSEPSSSPVPGLLFPQPQEQQQLQQQQPTQPGTIQPPLAAPAEGLIANGIIGSLIFSPDTKWVTSGNWTLVLRNGNVNTFSTNMTWYNENGTRTHTHELLNLRPTGGAGSITPDDVVIKGLMDVGTNHRIVWQNVHSTIDIKGGKTIAISLDDNETNRHFAGQTIYGIVKSFTQCSDVPGPNMEVLPICTT